MTTEEKAKAYDEALERAREQRDDYQKELNKADKNSQLAGLLRAGINAIEMTFPELAESEDERIRKDIIALIEFGLTEGSAVSPGSRTTKEEALAWLEKQKEENHDGKKWLTPEQLRRIEQLRYEAGFDAGVRSEMKKRKEQEPISFNDFNPDDYEVVMEGNATGLKKKERKPAEWGELQSEFKNINEAFEDEKIRKGMIDEIKAILRGEDLGFPPQDVLESRLAYLEKQKEQKPIISDDAIREGVAHFGITQYQINNWLKKHINVIEQKPSQTDNEKEYVRTLKSLISDFLHGKQEIDTEYYEQIYDWLDEIHIEQKPVEKQDYSGLNDLEKAIHRGFLAAGVENVPVGIIKETAKECLAQMKPEEWSEEDKDYYDTIVCKLEVIGDDSGLSNNQIKFLREHCPSRCSEWSEEDEKILENIRYALRYAYFNSVIDEQTTEYVMAWLKSLRPQSHWKPSEEQIQSLKQARDYYMSGRIKYVGQHLNEIAEQLEKLM